MAYLYTPKQIQEALEYLRIDARQGVTTREAAKIFEWRALEEFKIRRTYNEGNVRRHAQLKNIQPLNPDEYVKRYKVEDIFSIPLAPRRGMREDAINVIGEDLSYLPLAS